MIEMYTCTRTIKIKRGVGTVPTVPLSPQQEVKTMNRNLELSEVQYSVVCGSIEACRTGSL
jgi:hypothetical protein